LHSISNLEITSLEAGPARVFGPHFHVPSCPPTPSPTPPPPLSKQQKLHTKYYYVYLIGITGFLKPKFVVNMNPSTAINRNWQNVMVLTQLGTSLKAINIESHV